MRGKGLTLPLPPTIGALPNLQILELPGNRFSGWLPPTLGSMVKLEALELANNQLSSPAGGPLTYRLDLRNMTGGAVGNTSLSDTLPSDVTYISANPPPSSVSGNQVIWTLGTLPAGGSFAGSINVVVPAVQTRLLNQAAAQGQQGGATLTDQARFTTHVLQGSGPTPTVTWTPTQTATATALPTPRRFFLPLLLRQ